MRPNTNVRKLLDLWKSGSMGVPPVSSDIHRRDACAPWPNKSLRATGRWYKLFGNIPTFLGILECPAGELALIGNGRMRKMQNAGRVPGVADSVELARSIGD